MKIAILIAALLFAPLVEARTARSYSAKVAFVRANACPGTGLHKLPCRGFVIDHSLPLCAGGLDIAQNMAWSTVAESKRKDQEEFALCRQVRMGLLQASSDKADLCPVAKQQRWPHLEVALCDGIASAGENN